MSEIKSTNKYLVKRKYKTISGVSYPMDEYLVILYEEDSEDCGYIRPQYQWSATTGYLCDYETYTKYKREVKMVSYDSGVTWSVLIPIEERRGDVIAYDSYDCGKPMYRCVDTDTTYCQDNGDEWKLKVAAGFEPHDCSGNPFNTIVGCDENTLLTSADTYSTYHKLSCGQPYYFERYITSGDVGNCTFEIGSGTFSGWTSLSSLSISNSVSTIRELAFDGCCALSSKDNRIVIPRSVSTIEDMAFCTRCSNSSGYIGMHAKVLWETLSEIPEMAFVEKGYSTNFNYNNHWGFQSVTVPYGTLMTYRSYPTVQRPPRGEYLSWGNFGGLFQEDCTVPRDGWKMKATISGVTYYLGGDDSTNLTEFEATHIKCWNNYSSSNVFNELLAIGSIGDDISNIEVGEGVTTLETRIFRKFNKLRSITLPSSVTSIGTAAFSNCTSLTSVTIPNSVTSIGFSAFYNCTSLSSVTIPSSVTSIGDSAFGGCSSLTSVTIPSSVTSIGTSAFGGCSSLTSVTVEATTPPTLGNRAFNDTNNCPIYVPSESVDTYKAASGWSTYASRIVGF